MWRLCATFAYTVCRYSNVKNREYFSPAEVVTDLQGADGGGLEPEVGLEVLGDLPDQTLEGQLADQQLGRLLVATDLTQSHGTRAVPVGLLDAAGGRGGLASGLGGQLLPGGLASGGLTRGLLGTGHLELGT